MTRATLRGKHIREVTRSRVAFKDVRSAAVSPDGRRVVFEKRSRIWRVGIRGGRPTAITPKGQRAADPAFSPDGHGIVYVRNGRELVTESVGGSGARAVPLAPGLGEGAGPEAPRFSPDGRRLIFGCEDAELCLAEVDGSASAVILAHVGSFESGGVYDRGSPVASFSPNGDELVFNCGRNFARLCVSSSDGGGKHTIGRGSDPVWVR